MNVILSLMAKLGLDVASSAAGAASVWWLHQPKEPECLRKDK